MARLVILCPICGDERKTQVKYTFTPGVLVMDLKIAPCASWCTILR